MGGLVETNAADFPDLSHRHARADRVARVRAGSSARTRSWCSRMSRTIPIFVLGAFTAFLTAFYMTRLVVVVFFGRPRSDHAARSGESPTVMVVPLAHSRDSRGARRVRLFRAALPRCCLTRPRRPRRCRSLRSRRWSSAWARRCCSTAGARASRSNIALFRNRFYLDEIYTGLIAATQDVLALLSRVHRSLDSRWRDRPGNQRRRLGFRVSPAAAPGRQPAGLRLSVWPRHRRSHLLHRLSADAALHCFRAAGGGAADLGSARPPADRARPARPRRRWRRCSLSCATTRRRPVFNSSARGRSAPAGSSTSR